MGRRCASALRAVEQIYTWRPGGQPQESAGESRRAQESPGEPRTQESPGEPREAQECPNQYFALWSPHWSRLVHTWSHIVSTCSHLISTWPPIFPPDTSWAGSMSPNLQSIPDTSTESKSSTVRVLCWDNWGPRAPLLIFSRKSVFASSQCGAPSGPKND